MNADGLVTRVGNFFLNGFFEYKLRKSIPYTHERFEISVCNINSDPEAKLSVKSQRFLVGMCGRNIHYINSIKSAGFRTMIVSSQYQAGYYLYGPLGCGLFLFNLYCFICSLVVLFVDDFYYYLQIMSNFS